MRYTSQGRILIDKYQRNSFLYINILSQFIKNEK